MADEPTKHTVDPTSDEATVPASGAAQQKSASPLSEAFPELDAPAAPAGSVVAGGSQAKSQAGRNIEAMLNVDLRVQVILGHARMPISQLLKLSRGSVIELDRQIGEPVDVVINDRLVARGDLVKLDDDRIGVTLTEIVKDYVSDN
ncbi:flagellar motor switch protein FliN [Seohaeicola saemankumensis]|uniref:flagellar motor switch protein FliN n=1 Tax=Seohaeicola TaxID=481178 RepID=UPI0035D0C8A5